MKKATISSVALLAALAVALFTHGEAVLSFAAAHVWCQYALIIVPALPVFPYMFKEVK